jgi:hypothetical protein
MKQEENTREFRTENRLGFYIFIFRLSGLDIEPQSSWKFYRIYALIILLCAYGTGLAVAVDLFLSDDLQHIMENARALLGVTNVFWVQNYVR